MKSRAARLTLLVLFLGALGAAAWLFAQAERRAGWQAAATRAFDEQARSTSRALADTRAAQQAYVAAGQGGDFWPARVADGVTSVRAGLDALRKTVTTSEAAAELDAALGTLDDFARMDRRAREYTRTSQNLLAADLIFREGLEMTGGIDARIERARAAEIAAGDAAVRTYRNRQVFALTAGAAAATLVVLLLLPGGETAGAGRQVVTSGARDAAPAAGAHDGLAARPAAAVLSLADAAMKKSANATKAGPADDLAFEHEGWSRASRAAGTEPEPAQAALPAPGAPADVPAAASAPEAPPQPPPVIQIVRPATDLRSLASLCTDLARVIDTEELPSLLDRASGLLEARGIILWIADPDARELNPIVAHGYPAQLVNRLGTIARDAENATAAAFRTSMLQTVSGDHDSNAAIAAPLVTPGGCVGVMAAEVACGAEQEESRLAAAAIVAAQLATLVGPPTRSSSHAEIAGA